MPTKRRNTSGSLLDLPLVRVTWHDAASRADWDEPDNPDDYLVEVQTVGFVTRKTKRAVTLAASINALGHVGDRTTIPRAWIQTTKRLSR